MVDPVHYTSSRLAWQAVSECYTIRQYAKPNNELTEDYGKKQRHYHFIWNEMWNEWCPSGMSELSGTDWNEWYLIDYWSVVWNRSIKIECKFI